MPTKLQIWENGIEYEVYVYPDGQRTFYIDDVMHRLDGPAIEFPNGDKSYLLDGHIVYNNVEDNTSIWKMTDKMKLSIFKYKLTQQ